MSFRDGSVEGRERERERGEEDNNTETERRESAEGETTAYKPMMYINISVLAKDVEITMRTQRCVIHNKLFIGRRPNFIF